MSSVIVAKAYVILAFKFVVSGTGVENTLSLTYPHKQKSREVISGDRGDQGVGPSLPIHLFGNVASKNRRTCEPQCGGWVVGKLSTAETLLMCSVNFVMSVMLVIRERLCADSVL